MFTAVFIIIITSVFFMIFKSWRETSQLKQCNLPILRLPPLWKMFILCLLKNKDFNFRHWLFQLVYAHCRMYDRERLFAYNTGGLTIVRLFKPEHVETIINNNVLLEKANVISDIFRPWLGNGLIISSGQKWKNRRKLLTQAFHFKILEDFCPLCTLDIIGETAMGVEINAQQNEESEYVKSIGKIQELIFRRMMYPWLWSDFVFNLTTSGREFNRLVNIVHNFTRKVITEKKKIFQQTAYEVEIQSEKENIYFKSKKRMAFLDLLLYYHFKEKSLTEVDIREEVDTFMFAGQDTTASAINWALYNLGLYQDIQNRAYEEILRVFGEDKERDITAKDIRELKYLECVLKESLRIYPSVPIIARSHRTDFRLNENMKIPGGALITIEIFAMHHDPETFPDPEIFNPERFVPENCKSRHNFAYIPFSAGPRNCLGQKFAMMEEKIIIANILRHFRLYSMDPRDKIIECGEIVLRPLTEVRMKFVER
ncbi:cytochrome P450 4C1-like isoform X2 [Centruroides sculpturatus]|uniref:cytochrome P450 4C1-like isoform X2 n=1 Tax=Centruroides sculpturatus TaxID=218467 RepID=UPI000C6EE15C|nr:cytochrome P450 4C1-like isoform X2 [Centruroides sculpturatus]